MPFLGSIPPVNYKTLTKQTITGDSSTAYTLNEAVANANEIEVFINNVRQNPSVDYTASSRTITFTDPLLSSDSCWLVYQGKAESTTIAQTSNIADGAVTNAKYGGAINVNTSASDNSVNINASGNVGIGTTTPARQLTIYEASYPRFAMQNSTTGQANGDGFQVNLSGSDVYVYNQENGIISFGTNDTERMQIQADGSLLLGTNDGGASGAGDMVVNGGIYIGGNQAANYLDDYEEGTWSPTPRGSSSDPSGYTSSIVGRYTKIGNKVSCWVNMTLNNDGSNGSGYFYIDGFPFTPNSEMYYVVEGHNCERLMTDMRGEEIRPLLTSNRVLFYYGSDNTAGMNTLQWGTHVNTNLRFRVTFSYTI